MSIKTYCDSCNHEITKENEMLEGLTRVHRYRKSHSFETCVTISEINEGHDICKYCVIDSVKRTDDRPNTN